MTKYTDLSGKVKYLIKTINRGKWNSIEAGKNKTDFMNMNFNSDDNAA